MALPGSLGPEVKLDVAGIGPGGEPIDDAGELSYLPRSRLEGEAGVVLHRLADSPWEEGVHWYESDELVAVVGGVSEVVPVDLHIPGCPPTPTAMLRGLLALLERVDSSAVAP